VDGKTSDIKIVDISYPSPCVENACMKIITSQVFKPAILKDKTVPARITMQYQFYIKPF
jgi:hypothetical protein